MRSTFFAAIFLLVVSSSAGAQTIIRETRDELQENKSTASVQASEASEKIKQRIFAEPQTTPTPKPTPDPTQPNGYVRPDAKKRFNRYVNNVVGPVSLAKNVVVAGISTWRNSPEEWGDHWDGFGRRVASNFGKTVIKQTAIYALDEAFAVDSRYYRSRKKDFKSKLTNALLSPVTARNKEGKRVFGLPRIAGTYAGSIIPAEVWYPGRFGYKDGLKGGTISLGLEAAFNIFKAFVLKK